jgi:hypothetical protein
MFELPKSCYVNKFIPKKVFYEKVGVSSNVKEEFINLVDRITWLYKLSEDTLGITKTDEIEEIQTCPYNGHWAEIILHAEEKGKFRGLVVSEDMIPFVYEKDLWVAKGDLVEAFSGANNAIGTLVLKFDTAETKEKAFSELSWIKIDVEEYER